LGSQSIGLGALTRLPHRRRASFWGSGSDFGDQVSAITQFGTEGNAADVADAVWI
jgi:hypothetical protein